MERSDQEQHQLAALAAGRDIVWHEGRAHHRCLGNGFAGAIWNPKVDDGDAFRLLVSIRHAAEEKCSPWGELSRDHQDAWIEFAAALGSGDHQRARLAIFNLAVEAGRAA